MNFEVGSLEIIGNFASSWLIVFCIFYHYSDYVQIKSSYYYSHQILTCSVVLEKKTVLNNVSGLFRRNQVGAILGCSGSGKSTLMNILSGYM